MSTDTARERADKAAHIRRLLDTEGDAVSENTQGFNAGRYESVARLDDYEALKREARSIKEDAIERLPELVDQLTDAVEARGGHVYVADDAADANEYVGRVVADRNADRVIKSKSMTSEEIEVNEALETDGVDVVETDLGEWVLQVADEAPSHIVAPAIHKSRAGIAELFEERFGPDTPLDTAEDLTRFAREKLSERICDADVGMTGANFVAADTGTMALVTSEGNARKCVAATDTHVAVAGIEKLVPTVEDLSPFVELIGRSGTGQDITSYLTLLTPPGRAPTIDFEGDEPVGDDRAPDSTARAPDRDFHLVLIDNGRWAMRDDDALRETLYCIRCSACANSCANFQHVGGHAFGGETYSGGIATGWEAGVHGLDAAAEFNDLCTGCSRCVNQCPVGIDIPWINTVVRDRINRGADAELDWLVDGLTPDAEPGGLSRRKRFFGNFERIARVGNALAPVSNWLSSVPGARRAMEHLLGVDRRRDLPEFAGEPLVSWFDARGPRVSATDARREAVLYPDLYTNRIAPERGRAAVRTLEALDVHVRVPDVRSSGRAPLSQGMIATATDHARDVRATLEPHVQAGRDVVVVEPSALAMFRDDYAKLTEDHEPLRNASYELFEYLHGLLDGGDGTDALDGARASDPAADDGVPVRYHSHCQQRTLGVEGHTEAVLDRLGYDVRTSDVECCGMAGSFGYKSEYYELSMDVGADLRDQLADGDGPVVASGTSCLDQLDALLTDRPRHPIRLIAPDPDGE